MMKILISIVKLLRSFWLKVSKKLWSAYAKRTVKSYQGSLYVGGPTYLTKRTELGKNTNFNGMRILGDGNVKIGSFFHSGQECMIITGNHNFDFGEAIPYDKTVINKDVTIGDCVWFGSRVLVLGGVTIGEGAIIQAGAVVVKDIPKYGIAGGSPAKTFKSRDADHYEKLKAQGKFW